VYEPASNENRENPQPALVFFHGGGWVAECVLSGLEVLSDPPDAMLMPDETGIAQNVVENASDGVSADLLDMSLTGSA
jgi:hypothetical protein